jgi:hypothetical protein
MLKITAEEVNFIIYQYLHETGRYLPQYLPMICTYLFKISWLIFRDGHINKAANYLPPSFLALPSVFASG